MERPYTIESRVIAVLALILLAVFAATGNWACLFIAFWFADFASYMAKIQPDWEGW